jgi:NADPH2:quinone reductase
MHAWLCENPTGVDALHLERTADAAAQGRRGADRDQGGQPELSRPADRAEQVPDEAAPALRAGSEYAGVVQAVGEGVTHLKVGQNVACLSGTGGFGTHTIAPAACACRCPRLSLVDAAAFIMIYATSWHALMDRAQLKAGETVLVLGAAGGVGTAAIQIAKAPAPGDRGASTDEKCALCAPSAPTPPSTTARTHPARFREAIKAATDGKGPDVIYDPVGGDFAEPAFRSIAWRGRYLVVGFASGPIPACR